MDHGEGSRRNGNSRFLACDHLFIVPLLQAASLTVQWFYLMTKKQRSRNTVRNKICSAWQYMEVYVLLIIIAAWLVSIIQFKFSVPITCDSRELSLPCLTMRYVETINSYPQTSLQSDFAKSNKDQRVRRNSCFSMLFGGDEKL